MESIFKKAAVASLLPLAYGGAEMAACSGRQSGDNDCRPNIVYIMADDHTCQAISAYGHPISRIAETPNIDRIAESGIIFRNAFVENSISAPSRATLLTGMYSHNHGQKTLQYGIMDTTKTYFSEVLQKAGYTTAVFGKWHLSIHPRGFDWYDIFYDQGEYYNPVMKTPETGGKYVRQDGYATEIVTDHALRWLDEHKDSETPFCILLHHKAPHRNWMPQLDEIELYEDMTFPEPETLFDDYSTRGGQMRQQQLRIADDMGFAFDFKVDELKNEPTHPYIKDSWDKAMSTLTQEQRAVWEESYRKNNEKFLENIPDGKELVRWKYQRYVKDYCRTVKTLDDEVGRVLDYLEANDLMDNTIIIYTSDQGFFLGEHGLYDKRFMYEEAFRTPLLVSWPGHIRPGSECEELVQNIDYAPTLLDVAGVDAPSEMDGKSMLPLFATGKVKGWRDELYYQYYDYPAVGNVRLHYGIRTDRYKLIHWFGKGENGDPDIDSWEFFDLKRDPKEINNLYNDAAKVKIINRLKDRLYKKREELKIVNN